MTEAEQVACDALRMAGLGEVADNLAWVREAARLREYIDETLQCDVEGYCASCGVHAESESHRLSCRLVSLYATREGWQAEEIVRAHDEALRQERIGNTRSPMGEWAQRQEPSSLFGIDPTTFSRWAGEVVLLGSSTVTTNPIVPAGEVWAFRPSDFALPPKK